MGARRSVVFVFVVLALAVGGLTVSTPVGAAGPSPQAFAAEPRPEIEPNDTPAAATVISSRPARFRGGIDPSADVDVYSFAGMAGQQVYASVITSPAFNAVNSVLELIAPDQATVIETDDNDGTFGPLSSSIAGAVLTTPGQHYLRVTAVGSQMLPYDLYLSVQSGIPTAEAESNDTFATAQSLPVSGWMAGALSSGTDEDFYSFPMSAGDTVFMSLDLDPERDGGGTDIDGALGLREPSGNIWEANDAEDAAPAIDSEMLVMTARSTDTYAARVRGTAAGTYRLSVAIIKGVNVSCFTYDSTGAVAIPDLGATTSTISVPDAIRVGRVAIEVDVSHNFMRDVDLQLTTPAGSDVVLFDLAGSSTAGVNTAMDVRFDDNAALPADRTNNTFLDGLHLGPVVPGGRLDWPKGEVATGTWTLTARDDGFLDLGTLNSWRVIVCHDPAPIVQDTLYSSNFDADDGGFTAAAEWERGTPTFAPITTCAGGSAGCFKTDLDGTYNNNSSQDLVSPPVSLASVTAPVYASWAHRYQMQDARFYHYSVDVREVANPANKKRLFEHVDPDMKLNVGNAVTVDSVAGWGSVFADISSFVGLTVELVFHVDAGAAGVPLAGVAIDDVGVFDSPRHRSDATIKFGRTATAGNNVYNVTGAGQTRTARVARSRTATFTLGIQNDGEDPEAMTVRGCATSRGFAVSYFRGATNITGAVRAGTYSTGSLAPGATRLLTMKIAVRAAGPVAKTCTVTATSAVGATRDTVKGIVRVA